MELTGDWKKAAKKFANLERAMQAAVARAGTRLGPDLAQAIRVEMGGSFPRLHPFTAERKGAETPLVGGDLEQAITFRVTPQGRVLGEAERISVAQALRAITLGAAWTLKLDHEIGSIECGKRADFAVLDDDPYETPPAALKGVRVWGTVLSGRVFAADV